MKTNPANPKFRTLAKAALRCLAATLLALNLTTVAALAAGCFPDAYYEFLFKPVLQETSGGDLRLVGLSDYLAAKGEDPHSQGTGSGCMCGVNNGRWDQMLFNASPADSAAAPVAFRINRIEGRFHQKDGGPKGKVLVIDSARLKKCFGVGLKTEGHLAFNAPGGLTGSADILEQGENFLGCLCLEPGLQNSSGHVLLKVGYTPLIMVSKLEPGAGFKGLKKGHAIYYQVAAPAGAPGLKVELAGAEQAEMYWRPAGQPWAPAMADWKKGNLSASPGADKSVYWVMVRATGDGAAGEVRVSPAGAAGPAAQVEAAGAGQRTFKAYMLGLGSEPKKTNKLETETRKMPCCSPES